MVYLCLSYDIQTIDLRRSWERDCRGGFMPPAFAQGKPMGSLLRLVLVPSRFPAFRPQTSQISNRYNKLLESPATHTKQTTAPRSNRYKNRFSPPHSFSLIRRLASAHLAKRPKSLQPQASSLQPLALLIANEMRSPRSTTNSKGATYDFLTRLYTSQK